LTASQPSLRSRYADFQYDDNGNLISETEQFLNSDGSWVNSTRFVKSYNADNQVVYNLIEWWVDEAWVLNTYVFYEYDDQGRVVSETHKTYRHLYTYNQDGALEIDLLQSLTPDSTWEHSRRYVYDLVPGDPKPYGYTEYLWTNLWNKLTRQTYAYDSNGNITERVTYSWNITTWIKRYKYNAEYDSKNNNTYWELFSWGTGGWQNEYQTYQKYDDDSNLLEIKSFRWYNAWRVTEYLRYHYSPALSLKSPQSEVEFSVFPNPATSFFTVQGETLEQVAMYDAQGKMVAFLPSVTLGESQIQTEQLPDGVYHLRASGKNGSGSAKTIVIRH
jgi:hypothetical protein